ncbi:hypothetical protein KM043_015955 [Ampulex compressa]|nr:hypothetical protein KM043_015955 [Ampulex compressa]
MKTVVCMSRPTVIEKEIQDGAITTIKRLTSTTNNSNRIATNRNVATHQTYIGNVWKHIQMSESDLLTNDHIDGLDGLENGQDGDAIMQCDGVKRELSEANIDDPELEAIKARVREMEEEAEKLKQLQSEVDKQMNMGSPPGITSPLNMSLEDKMEVDNRSIYVGNVDYGATAEELEQHFHGCGSVNRVTILCNKFDGHPKGFAYIEFAERDSVQTAMAMDESMFRGRQIKVMPKRTNKPGLSMTNRGPRGARGYRDGLEVIDGDTICHIDHINAQHQCFRNVKKKKLIRWGKKEKEKTSCQKKKKDWTKMGTIYYI